MKIIDIVQELEAKAPPMYQESYDNSGLLTGSYDWDCSGVLCTLDVTEAVMEEALSKNINLIVAHHPLIFKGLKRLTGANYVERLLIKAIENKLAIYAIHTNLDNVIEGVNATIANKLGLVERSVLDPKPNSVRKLSVYVPQTHVGAVQDALFAAGAGSIGNYTECSFFAAGSGTFKAGQGAQPYVGSVGSRHVEAEVKLETVYEVGNERSVLAALKISHPYEEIAYDLYQLENAYSKIGSGIVGKLPKPVNSADFLQVLKNQFGLTLIRHTQLLPGTVQKVAVCGGAGSFLINKALGAKADVFVTADLKYHEFFEADGRMLLCDIGHFESEQFTRDWLTDVLQQKFPNFAVLKSVQNTNPVYYYF